MHESEKIINENGSICVQNNKIIVKNPIGNGSFPIIIPPSKGHLYIDGQIITRPFKVKEENKIEFEELNLPFKRSIEIITSKSAIEAYASVEYEGGKSYSLKDREENYSLALEVIEKEGEVPPNITKEELDFELKKMKISYGIDEEAIKQIVEGKEIKNVLIARGKAPEPPIEDKIKIFFNTNNKEHEEDEKID